MKEASQRWWDIMAAGLLLAALIIVSIRLYVTNWADNLEVVQFLTLLGVIIGLALGQSRFSKKWVTVFAVVYTLFAIPWQLGLSLHNDNLWPAKLNALGVRLWETYIQFVSDQPVQDTILFLALMAVIFWVVSLMAGYYLTRYADPWVATIPGGVILFVVHSYDVVNQGMERSLALYVILVLVIVGRLAYLRNRAGWKESRVFIPSGTEYDLSRGLLLLIAVMVIASGIAATLINGYAPAETVWKRVKSSWEPLRARLADAFAPLESHIGGASFSRTYSDMISLGNGAPLGDELVFTVRPSDQYVASPRYYWRARSYDQYYEGKWVSTYNLKEPLTPENFETLTFPIYDHRNFMIFTFIPAAQVSDTIFTVAQPIWVSHPAQTLLIQLPDEKFEITGMSADPVFHHGDQYDVRAWVSKPSVSVLNEADEGYPEWIVERYLQLPVDLSPRFRSLAEQITEGLSTPYEKTRAITSYLRNTIEYKERIPDPPKESDPLEWFLFDFKQGFCNYYASAEVLLLRSIGIPARLSIGYAQGSYDYSTGIYTVLERDGHAWPEVFFTTIGWIEFEPTASQPEINFPESTSSEDEDLSLTDKELERRNLGAGLPDSLREDAPAETASQDWKTTLVQILRLFLIILVIGLLITWVMMRRRSQLPAFPILMENILDKTGVPAPIWLRRWSRRATLTPLEAAYASINQSLKWLGHPPKASDTPAERTAILLKLLPEMETQIRTLLLEYQIATFSTSPANVGFARYAGREIKQAAVRAVFRRIIGKSTHLDIIEENEILEN
jgi:transglutaminase-like putative cysteine protease